MSVLRKFMFTALTVIAVTATPTIALASTASPALTLAGGGQLTGGQAAASNTSFGCHSSPRFVSSNNGTFKGRNILIHSGPEVTCKRLGQGSSGARLKVWCFTVKGTNHPILWVFLSDKSTNPHINGWSEARFVTWSGAIPACTT